jgi:glutamate transport system permease protein
VSTLQEAWPFLRDGFEKTITLLVLSMIFSTVMGTALAAMRVSPVWPFRMFGAGYVNIFRNTPLIVLFILVVEGFPPIDVRPSLEQVGLNTFETLAVIALSVYTAAFVCEVVRSGVNTVDAGQAEAARSVGMTFGQTLRIIVLPQAFRSVIPPLASVYIALAKNTSVAAAFGVLEATAQLSRMNERAIAPITVLFLYLAAGYIIIVWTISAIAAILERRLAVAR